MKRREAIEKTGWILKSAIFTPGLISAIQSCQQKINEPAELFVLDPDGLRLANAIADTIFPGTDAPSASEVGVVTTMDLLLRDVFDQQTSDHILQGLDRFDQDCQSSLGGSFTELEHGQRTEYLEPIDSQVMNESYQDAVPFYYTFKRLCVEIYYSSEQGIKQNLDYQPVPGPYQGDVALKPGDKIAVGNQM